jgi:hypothetical protein
VCVYGDIDRSADSGKGITPQQTEVNEVEKAAVEDAIAKRQAEEVEEAVCIITQAYGYQCQAKVAAEEAADEEAIAKRHAEVKRSVCIITQAYGYQCQEKVADEEAPPEK